MTVDGLRMDFYFKVMRGRAVGADSIRRNEICRLFILPEYQGGGRRFYGVGIEVNGDGI